MRFSERLGYKKPKMELQMDEVDDALKVSFINLFVKKFLFNDHADRGSPFRGEYNEKYYTEPFKITAELIWGDCLMKPLHKMSKSPSKAIEEIILIIEGLEFPEFYDFLECCAANTFTNDRFTLHCNQILEKEKSAFRFVGNQLTQIANKTEIEEIETAQGQRHSKSVATHISSAVALYSNRADPDYRNLIKESISAVEAAARKILGDEKNTLGAALKKLGKDKKIHPSFEKGLSSLYGWTNDSSGIRHSLMSEENLTEADARYMLVSCSAFANYLLSRT